MADNFDRVIRNVRKMADVNAPDIDIDTYLRGEGFSRDDFVKAMDKYKKSGTQRYDYGAGQAALQGLTFGFADELQALKEAALGRGTYEQNMAAQALAKQLYEQENPKTAMAAEVAGSLPLMAVPGVGAYRAAKLLQEAPAVVRGATAIAAPAVTGAITGALGGAGAADVGQAVQGAKVGGAFGGAFGAAAPVVSKVAGSVGGKVLDVTAGVPVVQGVGKAVGAVTGQVVDAGNRARQKLLEALYRDVLTPQQIEQKLAQAGTKPVMLADVTPSVTSLADIAQKYPGAAMKQGREALTERGASQAERIKTDISNFLGQAVDPYEFATTVSNRQQVLSKPLYEKAYQEGANISNFEIDKMLQLPQFKEAYQRAKKIAALEGRDLPETIDGFTNYDLKTLDYVKRGLDDVIYSGKQTGGIGATEMRALNGARNRYVQLLDNEVPSYAEARATFAGDAKILEALDMGKEALKGDARQIAKTYQNLTPSERESFRIGVVDEVRNRINSGADSADVYKRIFGSQEKRDQLKAIFPDEASFNKFQNQMSLEKQMRQTQEKILGNSATVERQIARQNIEAEPSFIGQMIEQGPLRGTLGYLKAQGQGIAGQTAEELAPLLFSTSKPTNLKTLQELADLEKKLKEQAAIKAGLTTGATAPISGLLGQE